MKIFGFIIALAILLLASQAFAADGVYMGVRMTVVTEPSGIQLEVVQESPAELAGLRTGDVIIGIEGKKLEGDSAGFLAALQDVLKDKQVGDALELEIFRPGPLLSITLNGAPYTSSDPLREFAPIVGNLKVGEKAEMDAVNEPTTFKATIVLAKRPEVGTSAFAPNEMLLPGITDTNPQVRTLMDEMIDAFGIRKDCDDLWMRLYNRATPDDGYRLKRTTYILRDGLKDEAVTRDITDRACEYTLRGIDGYSALLDVVRDLQDIAPIKTGYSPMKTGLTAEQHLDQLYAILDSAATHVNAAFADFTDEEKAFLETQREQLTDVFCWMTYIHEDEDRARMKGNIKLVEMAKRINYRELMLAQMQLARIADSAYLKALQEDLRAEFASKLTESDLLVRDTPLGKLVISGTGKTWRQGEAPALLIDLGGDDFYTTTAGSGTSLKHPVGMLIEFGGNDTYSSTQRYSQGSGSMGVGLLIDLQGDDEYIGLQWSQGTGFMGAGTLIDCAGDDTYRGEELMQGAAIFGVGLKLDLAGNDRTEAQCKSQGFGGARAIGLHIDAAGDDFCYATGKYPTNYGDAGIFDSWSQGCAMGFREYASGGMAGMLDLAGDDYYEAGNFSQGGGYYFGYGFQRDFVGDDRYIGSRYNQGFCAHQAVGCFIEDSGNDYYHTRQAVAQGLAWDECVCMFIEGGGDDVYEGGGGFSQGASAHNALCVMWDRGGNDVYDYPAGQARAGGNDYHGGTSLSLFIDEGGGVDSYNWVGGHDDLITGWPQHGVFCDLPGSIGDALAKRAWKKIFVEPTKP
jgi:hypothetical protein